MWYPDFLIRTRRYRKIFKSLLVYLQKNFILSKKFFRSFYKLTKTHFIPNPYTRSVQIFSCLFWYYEKYYGCKIVLTHFWPIFLFHTPLTHKKTKGFLVSSGGIKWEYWAEMCLNKLEIKQYWCVRWLIEFNNPRHPFVTRLPLSISTV